MGASTDITLKGRVIYKDKLAQPIPVQEVTVNTLYNADVYSKPNTLSSIIRMLPAGTEIVVKDYRFPDSVGFGDENKKFYQLADETGFVLEQDIPAIKTRGVKRTYYVGTQKYIEFDDNTYMPIREPVTTYTVPNDGGKYKRMAFDWERPDWGYKPRVGLNHSTPQTIPMWTPPDFFSLTEDYQRLWYDLIVYWAYFAMTEGQEREEWLDITTERKALTDNHGLAHEYTDYIVSMFLANNKPIMQKGLGFGGSLVKIRYGSTIFAIDMNKPAPTLEELLEQPWLWGWCTVITGDGHSIKWPNIKRFSDNSVPYLIIGPDGKNTIDKEHLVSLEPGAIVSPFV